jgi:hypothetical protein
MKDKSETAWPLFVLFPIVHPTRLGHHHGWNPQLKRLWTFYYRNAIRMLRSSYCELLLASRKFHWNCSGSWVIYIGSYRLNCKLCSYPLTFVRQFHSQESAAGTSVVDSVVLHSVINRFFNRVIDKPQNVWYLDLLYNRRVWMVDLTTLPLREIMRQNICVCMRECYVMLDVRLVTIHLPIRGL